MYFVYFLVLGQQLQTQTTSMLFAGALQIINIIRRHAQAPTIIIVADPTADNHQLILFEQILMLLVDLTENRHLRSEEHTSELQSRGHLVCRLLLEKKNTTEYTI